MSADQFGPLTVERDVTSGEHLLIFTVDGATAELTRDEAVDLWGALPWHLETYTCQRCGKPAMPNERLCPRCTDDDEEAGR